MQIYQFENILKPVLWGGSKLTAFKQLPANDEPIGESWEISAVPGRESIVASGEDKGLTLTQLVQRYGASLVGEDVYRRYGDQFPLLVKFIDAKRDLSIQVHPNDEQAQQRHGCAGKTEMWYIIQADDDALIRTGFNQVITPEEYERRVENNTILDVIHATPSSAGKTFFIPAGQIHAIGAGNLLAEIQQSSDITYRVYDYDRRDANGNPRELHTRQAREVLNYDVIDSVVHYEPLPSPAVTPLVHCPKFNVDRVDFEDGYSMVMQQPHSFVVMMCLMGETVVTADGMEPVHVHAGQTVLVPAVVNRIELAGKAQLLTAMVPEI